MLHVFSFCIIRLFEKHGSLLVSMSDSRSRGGSLSNIHLLSIVRIHLNMNEPEDHLRSAVYTIVIENSPSIGADEALGPFFFSE